MVVLERNVVEVLKQRIVTEYREMPGLALTIGQARRLWGCDSETCLAATGDLVRQGILRWSRDGLLIAAWLPDPQQRPVWVPDAFR